MEYSGTVRRGASPSSEEISVLKSIADPTTSFDSSTESEKTSSSDSSSKNVLLIIQ